MRRYPFRPNEIDPKTALGVCAAGNASASTLKVAATVVVTDLARGVAPAAPASPKAKASPKSKVLDTAERKKQRESLRFTIGNWDNVHKDNIKGRDEPDPNALDELESGIWRIGE